MTKSQLSARAVPLDPEENIQRGIEAVEVAPGAMLRAHALPAAHRVARAFPRPVSGQTPGGRVRRKWTIPLSSRPASRMLPELIFVAVTRIALSREAKSPYGSRLPVSLRLRYSDLP